MESNTVSAWRWCVQEYLTSYVQQNISAVGTHFHTYYVIIMPRAYGSLPVCHFHEFLLTQASGAAANRFIDIKLSCGVFKIVRILI